MCDCFFFAAQRAADQSKAAAEYILQRRLRKKHSSGGGFHPLCASSRAWCWTSRRASHMEMRPHAVTTVQHNLDRSVLCGCCLRNKASAFLNFVKLFSLWFQPEWRKQCCIKICGIKLAAQITRLLSPLCSSPPAMLAWFYHLLVISLFSASDPWPRPSPARCTNRSQRGRSALIIFTFLHRLISLRLWSQLKLRAPSRGDDEEAL